MSSARAVIVSGAGGVEVLSIEDVNVRDPGPGEVLVEVAAAGLNRADILQRRGLYAAPPGVPANILGLEYAGTVAAVGAGVSSVTPGSRVMGIVGGGAMTTHLVVHERELIPVPEGMRIEDAAGVPEVFLTAYDALCLQGGMGLGTQVLIHSVASGVGTAALQLAAACGARAIGTTRHAAKLERAQALRPFEGVVVKGGAFADSILALTGGAGVELILDTVGAAYLAENLRAVAKRGRIVAIGTMGGATGNVPLGMLLAKRASLIGTVLRSRPLEEKIDLAQRFSRLVIPMFAAGVLRPVVEEILPMSDIAKAHERMEQNESFGKIVLRW